MQETPAKRKLGWLFPILVVIIAIALIGYILLQPGDAPPNRGSQSNDQGEETTTDIASSPLTDHPAPTEILQPEELDFSTLVRRDSEDKLAVGQIDSPVVLVVVSDYLCTFCAKWSEDTLPALQPYVDRGDLRIEWHDTSLFGPTSKKAAQAAYAAGEQDAFLDYHEALFAGGVPRSPSELSDEKLLELARDLGLDVEQFSADMNSPEAVALIEANDKETVARGTFSTPSFVIGDQPLVGAQPTEVFITAVEEAIGRAETQ